MKKTLFVILATCCIYATIAGADPLNLVSTSPQLWGINVNPATQRTISLTFDQKLRGKLSDWIGLDVLSPPSNLQTKFSEDHKSCSIDVHLQAAKVYICALNERGVPGVGFQNEKGLSLSPTYLIFQTAGTPLPDDAPPRVLRSNPPNGTQGIDPSRLASITVIFDKPMTPKKHGLHLYENNQPVDISKLPFSYSADGKTFTLPYNFKPATTYKLELNNTKDIGFARTTRIPLWPVQIFFSTR